MTAAQHQAVHFSFQGRVYKPENVHQAVSGSVWLDQSGPDGRLKMARKAYKIFLSNLTRFDEVKRIVAYLKTKIPEEFEIEDLDTYTPDSRTSTA